MAFLLSARKAPGGLRSLRHRARGLGWVATSQASALPGKDAQQVRSAFTNIKPRILPKILNPTSKTTNPTMPRNPPSRTVRTKKAGKRTGVSASKGRPRGLAVRTSLPAELAKRTRWALRRFGFAVRCCPLPRLSLERVGFSAVCHSPLLQHFGSLWTICYCLFLTLTPDKARQELQTILLFRV